MFHMSRSSLSGGGGSLSHPSSSYPLSFQIVLDPKPRPFKPNIFGKPPYSQLRAPDALHVVEVSDSSSSESTKASGAEGSTTSSKTPIDVAGSSRGRKEKEVRAPEGSWSYDEVKSLLTQVDLDHLRLKYSAPDQVTLRVPEDDDLPSSSIAGEVALNRCFFKCWMRLPLQPFIRHLLRDVWLSPLQLNPNTWREIYCCYVLWREHFGVDPIPFEIMHALRLGRLLRK